MQIETTPVTSFDLNIRITASEARAALQDPSQLLGAIESILNQADARHATPRRPRQTRQPRRANGKARPASSERPRVPCPVCQDTFKTKGLLQRHMVRMHEAEAVIPPQ